MRKNLCSTNSDWRSIKDSASIVQLYHAIIGTPGCTWDEEYPSAEDVAEDIKLSCLYCLEDGIGTLVAVAAAGAFEELSHLSWDARMNKPCELARIGVHPSMQHKGIGCDDIEGSNQGLPKKRV